MGAVQPNLRIIAEKLDAFPLCRLRYGIANAVVSGHQNGLSALNPTTLGASLDAELSD